MKDIYAIVNRRGIVLAAIPTGEFIMPLLIKALNNHHDAADGEEILCLKHISTDSDGVELWAYNVGQEYNSEEVTLRPCSFYNS